jgi:hypothetical protein
MELIFIQGQNIAKLPVKARFAGLNPAVNTDEALTRGQLEVAGTGNALNLVNVGNLRTTKAFVQGHTAVAIPTTAAGTLAVVNSGVFAGLITSTSVAGVTLTLDSAANIIAFFATQGVSVGVGSIITFFVDASGGANTITVAVDAGATLSVTTPAITGGSTLTVSVANAVGQFGIYFTSATAAKLMRMY